MKNENQKPNYWAIIPATVRYDEKIGSTSKLLFAEITALSNQEGYCWASNQYFANLFKITSSQISRLVNELEDRGFIKTFIDKQAGNVRKIWPQVNADNTQDRLEDKTFEEKFDSIIGAVPNDLIEERRAFIDFFTATNDGGKKQHWQKQKTFSIKQRWATWLRNTKKWEKPVYKKVPTDKEIRKEAKENSTQAMIKNSKVNRTPEEQAKLNKTLETMRKNLANKMIIKK
jgi:hypothetical protein